MKLSNFWAVYVILMTMLLPAGASVLLLLEYDIEVIPEGDVVYWRLGS